LGGVTDLRRAWQLGLGGGATEAIVGGAPHQVPERYRYATLDPGATSARLAVIHGRSDDVVPLGESTSFAAGAPADVDLTVLEAGHLDLIDPGCAPARSAIDCAVQRSGVDSDAQIGGA
jgi:pimeloyl-ACP methyl ester carboxylesterase